MTSNFVRIRSSSGFSAVEVIVSVVVVLVIGSILTPGFLNHMNEVSEGQAFTDVASAATLIKEAKSHGETALVRGNTVSYGGRTYASAGGVYELLETKLEGFCIEVVNDMGVTAHYTEKTGVGIGSCRKDHGPVVP